MHIGDVADFNAQFAPQSSEARRQGHHYSCLAAFYSPHPAVLVLPHQVEEPWIGRLAAELAWDGVEVHSGIAADPSPPSMARALAARPELRRRIDRAGLPVKHWGRTEALGPEGEEALRAVHRFESKSESYALFSRIAARHPGVAVPAQQQVDSPRRLARLIGDRAAQGLTTVLKAPHGVGGYGTAVLTPGEITEAGGARALLRRLTAEQVIPGLGGLLVEEYVDGRGRLRDLTFDAVIAEDGTVHPVGVAVMHVEGTHYRGATVGPGAVPVPLAAVATRFGYEVGQALAEAGHRGWYDIDFVGDRAGRLAPTETNLRLTGPAVAFMLQARLDTVHGPGHTVRTLDHLPLGARLPQRALLTHLERLGARCAPLGVTLLPTIPTASYDELPSAGVALCARTAENLDAAEALVRAANQALGEPFDSLARA